MSNLEDIPYKNANAKIQGELPVNGIIYDIPQNTNLIKSEKIKKNKIIEGINTGYDSYSKPQPNETNIETIISNSNIPFSFTPVLYISDLYPN